MSVVARMYCGIDGALYIPKDKSALMKAIKQYTNVPDLPDGESIDSFANDSIGQLISCDNLSENEIAQLFTC